MTERYAPSAQWTHIIEDWITEEAVRDLRNFKSDRVNYKLALWDPKVNGVRYLKALIYQLAAHLGPDNRTRIRQIPNREVGAPITVRHGGERFCMDYLQAVFELEFIANEIALDRGRVLEVGAGYGRTCHALLSNADVASYHIVDLGNSLDLARRYLDSVLPRDQFAKIRFVAIEEVDDVLWSSDFDLAVNIDSFSEMPPATVRNYLALIADRCAHFYVKNPVGNYLDKSLDGHSQGAAVVRAAMESGILRDVIDIHDDQAVETQSKKFLEAYRPGDDWTCLADGWAPPWSHYWQALYRRSGR